ncbi:MAG: adenylate/guanylate cyclase domain-containing protein, partial [SAR324 cluster bacterium]|nr:adenylate/guanylate cyclase domain-containing protein [SAR324 cluster bacterium]
RNSALPDDQRMHFRIGINLGDVIVDEDAIYGDGVNVAARLEALAEPGGICISGSVHTSVENKLPLSYEFLGDQQVKNIAKPRHLRCCLPHGGRRPGAGRAGELFVDGGGYRSFSAWLGGSPKVRANFGRTPPCPEGGLRCSVFVA